MCACALVALSSCVPAEPGFRAGTGGYCPDGEDCSPDTPAGLYFRGAIFGDCFLFCDGDIKTTAVGGTQEVTVYRDEWADVPFNRWFAAATLGESFAVDDVSPPDVVVAATAPEASTLRILDPTTGELFDRVGLKAATLDYALAEPAHALELGLIDEISPWAIYTEHASLVIALHDRNGQRLVDENMAVALAGDTSGTITRDRWDGVSLAGLQPGTVSLSVTAGTLAEIPIELEAVDTVDAIERIADLWDDPAEPVPVGRTASYCFRGLSQGVPVAGLDWAFTSAGVELDMSLFSNCVSIRAEQPGTVTLTVTAADASLTVAISVVESDNNRARTTPEHAGAAGRSAAPGERAGVLR